jgi:hypothetical protein
MSDSYKQNKFFVEIGGRNKDNERYCYFVFYELDTTTIKLFSDNGYIVINEFGGGDPCILVKWKDTEVATSVFKTLGYEEREEETCQICGYDYNNPQTHSCV